MSLNGNRESISRSISYAFVLVIFHGASISHHPTSSGNSVIRSLAQP